jgi:Mg-chelatase subunit ChlD
MKTLRGYEFRQGIDAFVPKVCSALGLAPVTLRWTEISTACIDAYGRMELSIVQDDAVISGAVFERYCGKVLHELLHRAFTDFDVVTHRPARQYIMALHNGIEDGRIERECIRLNMTGNCRSLLTRLIDGFVAEAMAQVEDWSDPAQYPFILAVMCRPHAKQVIPLPLPLHSIFTEAVHRLDACRPGLPGTRDTMDIAEWVFDQLKALPQQPPKQPPQQPPQGEGQGQDGEGQGEDGEGQGQGADGQGEDGEGQGQGQGADGQGQGQGQEGDGQGADGEGQGQEKGQEGPSDGQEGPQKDGDKGQGTPTPKAAPEAPKEAFSPVNNKKGEMVLAVETEPSAEIPEDATGHGTYDKGAKLSRQGAHVGYPCHDMQVTVPAKMRYDLKRMFDKSGMEEFQPGRKTGALNVRALPSLARGNDRLFKRRMEVEGIDSAVVIVLDVSGSMEEVSSGYRIKSAVKACAALLESLNAAGVATCVLTFASTTSVLKPWAMPVKKALGEIKGVRCGSTTNDYFAVKYAHELLLARNEQRKVCFVITDGGGAHYTALQVQSGERLGLTTVGVGIGVDISSTYPQSVCIDDVTKLGEVAFSQIKLAA